MLHWVLESKRFLHTNWEVRVTHFSSTTTLSSFLFHIKLVTSTDQLVKKLPTLFKFIYSWYTRAIKNNPLARKTFALYKYLCHSCAMHSCVWPHKYKSVIFSERELDLPVKAHAGKKLDLHFSWIPWTAQHLGSRDEGLSRSSIPRGDYPSVWFRWQCFGLLAPPAIHTASTSAADPQGSSCSREILCPLSHTQKSQKAPSLLL